MNYPLNGSRAPSQNLRGETRESEEAGLGGRLQAGSLPHLLHRHHIHLHVQLVPGAAQENAVDGTDVAVIASPSHGDMAVRGYAIVRGGEIHPSGAGWVDFDPTNNCVPSDGHITVAWGRDYSDVSPIYGVLLGGARHKLHVEVDVMPVE